MIETGGHGGGLTEIPTELNDADFRVLMANLLIDLFASVVTAIIYIKDLEGYSQGLEG
jgi:hypothetical protein